MDVLTPEWVVIGKFGRPQGIKGQIRVTSFTEPPERILQYLDWSIKRRDTEWQTVKRIDERVTPKHILVQVPEYTTREAIAELTNLDIAVPRAALPDLNPGEYYWRDLIGMRVTQTTGASLGIVDSVLETGANDVLIVIDEQKKRTLIPYLLDSVILTIDKNTREITVCWDLDF
jgi:16S rRNA processing protein RimM